MEYLVHEQDFPLIRAIDNKDINQFEELFNERQKHINPFNNFFLKIYYKYLAKYIVTIIWSFPITSLLLAYIYGHTDIVFYYILYGYICLYGDVEFYKFFVENGYRINYREKEKHEIMRRLIVDKKFEMFKLYIVDNVVEEIHRDTFGYLCHYGQHEIIKYLLDNQMVKPSDIFEVLSRMCKDGNVYINTVRFLLEGPLVRLMGELPEDLTANIENFHDEIQFEINKFNCRISKIKNAR